jgi:hypothetical protein
MLFGLRPVGVIALAGLAATIRSRSPRLNNLLLIV